METTIHVLPESVANKIAAGEVVQRPASVIKELMENAIDAGATQVDVRLKEAGRTLIQVVDNGKGMSPDDARVAFQRHATSKLKQADDLFHIRTMGFRGEALASIAAVAQVELVTRRAADELAWKIEIEGGTITNEEPTLAAQGSRLTVRNLFYNIPARRKFLGDNTKELKFLRDEFIQIALVYPQLSLSLTHNDDVLYQLSPGPLKQRILALFGKRSGGQLNKQLYPVDVQTALVSISGFVGDPAAACQRDPLQYFFVNGRFIRHKFFRSALLKAYETLLPAGMQPAYFLYFEVDPEALDVNIHPTKTEVKFEHEQAIWPIVHATVREALGKFNAVPSIDFDRDDAPDIDVFRHDRLVDPPKVSFNPSYNPFNTTSGSGSFGAGSSGTGIPSTSNNRVSQATRQAPSDWAALYEGFKADTKVDSVDDGASNAEQGTGGSKVTDNDWFDQLASQPNQTGLFTETEREDSSCVLDLEAPKFQLFATYIALNCRKSFVLIHQQRAHVRVLYERYVRQLSLQRVVSQTLMFPVPLSLDKGQRQDFESALPVLQQLGFQFVITPESIDVTAIPMEGEAHQAEAWLLELIATDAVAGSTPVSDATAQMALRLARLAAIPAGRFLSATEMEDLVLRLTEADEPLYTPDGKKTLVSLSPDDVARLFTV